MPECSFSKLELYEKLEHITHTHTNPAGSLVFGLSPMNRLDSFPPYVLITPARNEAAFIARTIQAVTNQTVLPEKWVIVNDGSTDETADIVTRCIEGYDW